MRADQIKLVSEYLIIVVENGGQVARKDYGAIEAQVIDHFLQKNNGNRTVVSKLLGLNRTTLVEKMKSHKLLDKYPSPFDNRAPEKRFAAYMDDAQVEATE